MDDKFKHAYDIFTKTLSHNKYSEDTSPIYSVSSSKHADSVDFDQQRYMH